MSVFQTPIWCHTGSAYHLLTECRTLLVISTSILTGWLYDATGSYVWPFAVTGGSIAVSGAMLYFIPLLTKLQHKRRTRKEVNMGVRIGVSDIQEVNDEEIALKSSAAMDSNGQHQSKVEQ